MLPSLPTLTHRVWVIVTHTDFFRVGNRVKMPCP
nr:MAG TPA: hypothetical protein [Caudoviricetes sp.]